MIKTDAVRREVEHVKRALTAAQRKQLEKATLANFLPGYYGADGESQLLMFLKKYPSNDAAIRSYVIGETTKYRINTKSKGV